MRDRLFMTAGDYIENHTYDPLYIRGYGIVNASNAEIDVSGTLNGSDLGRARALHLFPNPTRAGWTISYDLGDAGIVDLGIYDTGGRRIRTLLHSFQAKGHHIFPLGDQGLGQGVYFCRLHIGKRVKAQQKLVIFH
ncbi:MAG: T9SS type A sorting domain-containing protein [Candidatus Eisenbacteria bacterium]|nr:T9SS type A sorting domain-containing protein [Candidatus Eisenbacteria bacterium]MBU1949471.1 T9SS type A sorting domain-containing protein [Candidatus Eisenbacteria bacterium]